jgi:hypothetical protein
LTATATANLHETALAHGLNVRCLGQFQLRGSDGWLQGPPLKKRAASYSPIWSPIRAVSPRKRNASKRSGLVANDAVERADYVRALDYGLRMSAWTHIDAAALIARARQLLHRTATADPEPPSDPAEWWKMT